MSKCTIEPDPTQADAAPWAECLSAGLSTYALTLVVVVAGASLGVDILPRQDHPKRNEPGLAEGFANWDGVWYAEIARDGYSYNKHKASSVAFFPAFPLLGFGAARVTGLREDRALVVVANVCLVIFFVMLHAYVRVRFRCGSPELAGWTLLSFGLWPVSFFARMVTAQ